MADVSPLAQLSGVGAQELLDLVKAPLLERGLGPSHYQTALTSRSLLTPEIFGGGGTIIRSLKLWLGI